MTGFVSAFMRATALFDGWRRVLLLALVLGAPVLFWGASAHFVPCNKDCGETYIALHQAKNFSAFGLEYGLLEDGATSTDPAAHPGLYTHNINLGSLYYTAIEAVVGGSYKIKQLATFMVYLTALVYGVIVVWRISGSRVLATLFLLFFASDFEQVISFSFNGLRVWSWLPLLGISAHLVPLCRGDSRFPVLDWLFVLFFAVISFGVGYDFLAINFCIAFLVLIFFSNAPKLLSFANIKRLSLLICAFAIPVVLRQVQVMWVLGTDYWAKDLLISAAVKVPFLNKVFPLPPMEEVDAYYRALNVIRPPSTPSSALGEMMNFAITTLKYLVLPANGIITLATAVMVAGVCAVTLLRRVRQNKREEVASPKNLEAEKWLLALLAGSAFGMLIFMPLSLHVYLKHQFPLLAVPIHLAQALGAYWLIKMALASGNGFNLRKASLVVVAVLIVDHVIVNVGNLSRAQSIPSGWVLPVRNNPDASFAVSWVPYVAAPFTNNWVVAVQAGKERGVAKRLAAGQRPFEYDDYLLFYQKDADKSRDNYLKPDFWVYFPVDRVFTFDAPTPECRRDYLTSLYRAGEVPVASQPWVYRSENSLNLGARIDLDTESLQSIEVLEPVVTDEWMTGDEIMAAFKPSVDRPVFAKMSYNCRYNASAVNFDLKPEWFGKKTTYRHYPIRVTYKNGQRFIVQIVATHMNRGEQYHDNKPARPGSKQPTPSALAALMPDVPVYDQGEDYIIFDLRGIAPSSAPRSEERRVGKEGRSRWSPDQ